MTGGIGHCKLQQIVNNMPKNFSYSKLKRKYTLASGWGLSTHIDLHGCDVNIIKSRKQLTQFTAQLCKLLNVRRVGPTTLVRFGGTPELYGYSLVQLIETSSLTGHFVELSGNAYLDIFSCRLYNPNLAQKFCKAYFQASSITTQVLIRKSN